MPDQVIIDRTVLIPVTFMEIVVEVTVAVADVTVRIFPLPLTFVTATVTLAPVLNANPDGALMIIVPVPISPTAASVSDGPVSAVQEPPVVSAEIAAPPVAAVTTTVPAIK